MDGISVEYSSWSNNHNVFVLQISIKLSNLIPTKIEFNRNSLVKDAHLHDKRLIQVPGVRISSKTGSVLAQGSRIVPDGLVIT